MSPAKIGTLVFFMGIIVPGLAFCKSGLKEIISLLNSGQEVSCGYQVKAVYPHDTKAYTQGLFYEDGYLYEGTGRKNKSSLKKVLLETGRPLQKTYIDRRYHGEGITSHGKKIFQLTWKGHIGFIYDRKTFNRIGKFHYNGEGWGITSDGTHLIVSDGSAVLTYFEPDSFHPIRGLLVKDKEKRVTMLNELEYIQGFIFANVWKSDRVAIIDPQSGEVRGWIDFSGLLESQNKKQRPEGVLNGIAYDSEGDRLLVTGKFWPYIFEVRLVVKEPSS